MDTRPNQKIPHFYFMFDLESIQKTYPKSAVLHKLSSRTVIQTVPMDTRPNQKIPH